jgi:FMN phosphatase YigB (HAD superfamily)
MKKIKNIFFDLGNVLLDLDYQRARRQFRELLGETWDFEEGVMEANELFAAFQTGRIKEEDFFAALQKLAPRPVEKEDLMAAWNSMLDQLPWQRFAMLRRLKNKYRLFLISNTNPTHLRHFNRLLRKENGLGLKDFQTLFAKTYYSFEMGMGKPDPEVYRYIIRDSGIRPEETLFIDDLEANVRAAEAAGMKGYLHDPKKEIAEVLVGVLGY